MESSRSQSNLLKRMNQLEQTLVTRLSLIERKLTVAEEGFQLFSDGLDAYRKRWARTMQSSIAYSTSRKLGEKIRNDLELRFPHRKILECLAEQYDYENNRYTEINFSSLVKHACIGKNLAKQYLTLLEEKGLIERRDDGYRVFYRLK